MANEHMKRRSTSLIIEVQIKLHEILPHTVRMSTFKKKKKEYVFEDKEKLEPLCTFSDNVNWHLCCGKQYCCLSKY